MLSGRIDREKPIHITQASLKSAFGCDESKHKMQPGSNYGNHVCDCHYEVEGCMEEETMGNTCNCDANLPIPSTDTGEVINSI